MTDTRLREPLIKRLGAIASEVSASLSLKGALDEPLLYTVVLIGYLASFAFLSAVLKSGVPLGVAYGIWGALGVAGTAVLSSTIFGEAITRPMAFGMILVIAGVLLVEIGSYLAENKEAA